MQLKLLPLSATLLLSTPWTSQAGDLLAQFTFNDKTLTERVSGKSDFKTGDQYKNNQYGTLNYDSSITPNGSALQVGFLRYLRIPLAAVANSQGQFTIKFDYYHIASKTDNKTAWHAHSFALRDSTNNYGWSHGFQSLGNDYWSAQSVGLALDGEKTKGDADAINDFAKDEWHEYVLVFNNKSLSWYVDGVFAYQQNFTQSFANWDYANSDITLGARYKDGSITELDGLDHYLNTSTGNAHPGMVKAIFDEVKIWDGALSADDIKDVDNYVPPAAYTRPAKDSFRVNFAAQSVTLEIDSNEDWTLTNLPSWISSSAVSGKNKATLTLNIAESSLNESRKAQLSLNGTIVSITQSAYNAHEAQGATLLPKAGMHTIDYVFFDLKSPSATNLTDSKANQIFIEDRFNGVRTSIYGTEDHPSDDKKKGKPAHPKAGTVISSYYAPEIAAIKKGLARNPNLIVFASKKLNGPSSFPGWVLDSNDKVIPEQYAILLADYIKFMKSQGIPTHYLGLDNEKFFNKAGINPERFHQTVTELKRLATEQSFTMPILIGYEDYYPGIGNWVKNLAGGGWLDSMDLYGTHYYPEDRTLQDITAMESDISYLGHKERWHTELHWGGEQSIEKVEDGFASLLDMTDRGFNGLMWWAYSRTNLRGTLMQELTTNLLGYQPIMVLDHDGVDIIKPNGKLYTRAFKKGNKVILWVLNGVAGKAYSSYPFQLATAKIAGDIRVRQWTETESNGVLSTLSPATPEQFRFNIPERSVTSFSFNITQEKPFLLTEQFERANNNIAQGAGVLAADLSWDYDFSAAESTAQAIDSGRPFAGKHLKLTTKAGTQKLTHTLEHNAIFEDDTNATLKFKLLFNADAGANQNLQLQALSPSTQELVTISLATDAQQQGSLILKLNQSDVIHLSDLGPLKVNEVYDVTVSLNRVSDNQTDIYYNIYRNQMFWQQGKNFSTEVIATGTEVSQLKLNSTNLPISLDEISLQLEKADIVPVPGDLNGDQQTTAEDASQFRALLGKKSQEAGFNDVADLDQDGQISRRDYAQLFGQIRQQ